MLKRTGFAIACALIAAALYGCVLSLTKIGLNNGVPPVEVTFFRTSLIAVVLAIAAVITGERFSLPRAAWPSFAIQALATVTISVAYLASIAFISIGLAVIIFFTFPVMILLVAPLVEGHRPGPVRIAIAFVAFAGLAVAIGPSLEKLDPRGLGLAALAAIATVAQFLSGRAVSPHLRPLVLGSLVHAAIWPITLVIATWVGGGNLSLFPGGGVPALGYLALLGVGAAYSLAYFVHMTSLRNAPASTVAPFYNLEPIVTTGLAALLLGEVLALHQYAGGGMVLAALIASSLYDLQKARADA